MYLDLKVCTHYSQESRYEGNGWGIELYVVDDESRRTRIGRAYVILLNDVYLDGSIEDIADNISADCDEVIRALVSSELFGLGMNPVVILDKISISKRYRNKGYGTKFMTMILGFIKEVLCAEVVVVKPYPFEIPMEKRESSSTRISRYIKRLVSFYARFGFQILDPENPYPNMGLEIDYSDLDVPDYDELLDVE